jgi:hypothetical protein
LWGTLSKFSFLCYIIAVVNSQLIVRINDFVSYPNQLWFKRYCQHACLRSIHFLYFISVFATTNNRKRKGKRMIKSHYLSSCVHILWLFYEFFFHSATINRYILLFLAIQTVLLKDVSDHLGNTHIERLHKLCKKVRFLMVCHQVYITYNIFSSVSLFLNDHYSIISLLQGGIMEGYVYLNKCIEQFRELKEGLSTHSNSSSSLRDQPSCRHGRISGSAGESVDGNLFCIVIHRHNICSVYLPHYNLRERLAALQ